MLDILPIKKDFLEQNDEHLKRQFSIYHKYNLQGLRTLCKNCQLPFNNNHYDLLSHGVKYIICRECSHFNGDREEYNLDNTTFSAPSLPLYSLEGVEFEISEKISKAIANGNILV